MLFSPLTSITALVDAFLDDPATTSMHVQWARDQAEQCLIDSEHRSGEPVQQEDLDYLSDQAILCIYGRVYGIQELRTSALQGAFDDLGR